MSDHSLPPDSTSDDPGSTISRRRVLQSGAAVAGGLAIATTVGAPAEAASASPALTITPDAHVNETGRGLYFPNKAPLQATPFQKLPPGAVTAHGWLGQQLQLEVDGLCGRYDEISDYLVYDSCGWVDPANDGWEELPYWLRGFGDLGYVTQDERVLALAKKWIDGIVATQVDDGWFGPTRLRTSLENGPDFWPGMPLLSALRSWQEYSGDERIVPFMGKYFQFQAAQPDDVFNRSWGAFRWGDNIDSVYWLYNRTGDDWLLDLVHKMHAGSADYTHTMPTPHNVNIAQGFREPLQYGLLAGDPAFAAATYARYGEVMDEFGQFPGGGFAGDENYRHGFADPRQGFETCGIVEFMHSHEMLTRFTGDPVWADRCEELALNSLTAAFDPEQRVLHYVTSANTTRLRRDGQTMGQFDNNWAMQALMPGVHNYRCCPHNYGMGWPYFTEELWLGSDDRGLAASMYAPSTVTAKVEDGTEVTIREVTDYPFDETVTFTIGTPRAVRFPLHLRIPGWCDRPKVRINGRSVRVSGRGAGWIRVDREWSRGDTIALTLPMRTTVHTWSENNGAQSVAHGPLTYSLAIDETCHRFGGTEQWPEIEVAPSSRWNYALDLPDRRPESAIGLHRTKPRPGTNPFTTDGSPVRLSAPAREVPAWTEDPDGVVRPLQASPVRSGRRRNVPLIPMGAARLRITSFPRAASGKHGHIWAAPTSSWCYGDDDLTMIADPADPASSIDGTVARMTFWPHKATSEWLQYDFAEKVEIRSSSVYWYDDTGAGECRVPASWSLFYRKGDSWVPVATSDEYGVARDTWNTVTFRPVRTTALRIVTQLQDGVSAGVLRWRYDAR